MINRRQALPGELGVRGRFVPAHTAEGESVFPLRLRAYLPRGRPSPPRTIAELIHGLLEREGPTLRTSLQGRLLLDSILAEIAV